MSDIRERVAELVGSGNVVLFMKGTRTAPQCGFSASVVEILDEYLDDYATVNVLADPEVRQGIKDFSEWPTIPQLYVKGEFVGGSDIVRDLHQGGELEPILGAKPMAAPRPDVTVTEAAAAAFRSFHEGGGDPVVRLTVDNGFRYGLELDQPRAGDVVLDAPGLTLVMNRGSARRADGLHIDYVEGEDKSGFRIDNPNEPPRVQAMAPKALAEVLETGAAPHVVFDVRSDEERATASIAGTVPFDDAGLALLKKLEKDTPLVFVCHHGMRSQAAAEHARELGFKQVYNLSGGIDAWSREVDPNVPRY
jgi:monothiol glutaredoxin